MVTWTHGSTRPDKLWPIHYGVLKTVNHESGAKSLVIMTSVMAYCAIILLPQ